MPLRRNPDDRDAARRAPRARDLLRRQLDRSAARRRRDGASLVAPTIGAVTAGLWQQPGERDLRRGMPRAVRDLGRRARPPCGRHPRWRLGVEPLAELVGLGALRGARCVASRGSAGRGPAGSTGSRRCPRSRAERQHLALLLAVEQVVVVLHARRSASSRGARRRAAPCRTARRTSTRRRCSAPCRPSRRRAAPPASPRSACA